MERAEEGLGAPETGRAPRRRDTEPEFATTLAAAFDDLQVGQTFSFRRTFTDGDVALFCGVSGDFNPYHLDDTFAQQSWFGRRIIPGLLTASMLTHIGGLLGFLARTMRFEFVAPVYVLDTITCTVTITEKNAARRQVLGAARWVNQDGVEVLRGDFSGLPGPRRLAR